MTDKTILHYKITEKLGEGGMGIVYRAEDTRLERTVAIKFLPRQIAPNVEERERFMIEAKAAAALNHPNIATIHAIEEMDDELFIVMEYIEGRELEEVIGGRQLAVDRAVEIATQIAHGLQAAHEKGIVHRDIKSANIMITEGGQVKIMDFGLAKVRGGAEVTKVGTTLGTAAYMSPEQARGEPVDARSDIWSFGIVLYQMLTGRLPFRGDYEQAVIYSILNEEPEGVRDFRPDIPEPLDLVLQRTVCKDPAARFDSAADLVTALEQTRRSFEKPAARTFWKSIRQPRFAIPALALLILVGVSAYRGWKGAAEARRARLDLLPQIQELVEQIPWSGEGPAAWQAFVLATEAERRISDDPMLSRLWPRIADEVTIHSEPVGARVYARPYADDQVGWLYLGRTPLDRVRLPRGFSRLSLEMDDRPPVEDLFWTRFQRQQYDLLDSSELPAGMVFVEGATMELRMPGLDHLEAESVPRFFIDKTEVTNRAYKRFVDAGGYADQRYWKHPFTKDGREVSWEAATALFQDRTGRPGPATWEVGDYPDGQDDHPVTGISWYEAAAYAEFVGKSLPTVFHWNVVAPTWASGAVVPASNLGGTGLASVASYRGMTRYGTYDMAGNASEWVLNSSSRTGHRFILGGGWNDQAYAFVDAYTQDAFDRSVTNGFRCMKALDPAENPDALTRTIDLPFRDFNRQQPVDPETFDLLIRQFDYDRLPLKARIESEDDTPEDWTHEKLTFDAGYAGDRIIAHLFLPKHTEPPYQTVVAFPGDGGFGRQSPARVRPPAHILKSGRAFLRPIYKSTYERGDDMHSSMPNESNAYREHVIMWSKDLRRSIDYLETRDDIDTNRLAYYGVSWGGRMAPIMLALENRFKASVLYVAGLRFQKTQPEADPFNFLPRVTLPVLMLNGKHDFYFPVETSQKPFFELLGTPEKDKKWLVHEGSHTVPRTELVKETLAWLDRYLGPVELRRRD